MKVIWTPEAKETFNTNMDFLLHEWSEKVASDFLDRVEEVILKIQSNPRIYPTLAIDDQVHRCVVVKQISPVLPHCFSSTDRPCSFLEQF